MTDTYSKVKWYDLMYCLGGFALDDHFVTSTDRARYLTSRDFALIKRILDKTKRGYAGRLPMGTWTNLAKIFHRSPDSLKNSYYIAMRKRNK